MPHFFQGSLRDYANDSIRHEISNTGFLAGTGNLNGYIRPNSGLRFNGLGSMQSSTSKYPTGKIIKTNYTQKNVLEAGTDVQKLYEGSSGIKDSKVLYDYTTSSDKFVWPVNVQFTDGKATWLADNWNSDRSVIISESDPVMNFNNVVWVPPNSFKPYQEKQKENDQYTQAELQAKKEKKEADADLVASKKVSSKEFVVTGNDVIVRDVPAKSGKKITSLDKGDTVKLIGTDSVPVKDPYVKVIFTLKGVNKSGYFSTQYLAEKGSALAIKAVTSKVSSTSSKPPVTAPTKILPKDLESSAVEESSDTVKNVAIVGGAVAVAGLIFWMLKKYKVI